MKRKILIIVWLLSAVSMIVFGLGYLQADALNSVRAYVRGEGIWAKAQKDAVLHLYRFSSTGNAEQYEAFIQALSVIEGDHLARISLQQNPPNLDAARAGFLQGLSAPEDVESLISFYLRFKNNYYLKQAIEIWTEADEKIVELRLLGEAIYKTHLDFNLSISNQQLADLARLSDELSDLEMQFSLVLSDGARWIKQTTLIIIFVLLALFLSTVLYIAFRIMHDLSMTEKRLKFSENRFLSLSDSNLIGIFDWYLDGRIVDANDVFLKMLKFSREELEQGKINWQHITPEQELEKDQIAMQQIQTLGYCTPYEKSFTDNQGKAISIYLGGALLDGDSDRGIAFVVDQTEKKQLEESLSMTATVFSASQDGIVITDENYKILDANHAFCDLLHSPLAELISKPAPFYHSQLPSEQISQITQNLAKLHQWTGDSEIKTADNHLIPVRLSVNPVYDEQNKVHRYVSIYTDIRARKALEAELKNMAHHDYLTGLANRALFQEHVTKAIARAKRHHSFCALIYIDLDKFKPVNDTFGHEAGDLLLIKVAERLKSVCRESDVIARLGGDEFVIIIDDLIEVDLLKGIAEKIINLMESDFSVNQHTVNIACSIGIAYYPLHGENSVELSRAADSAMYVAKRSVGSHFCIANDPKSDMLAQSEKPRNIF